MPSLRTGKVKEQAHNNAAKAQSIPEAKASKVSVEGPQMLSVKFLG